MATTRRSQSEGAVSSSPRSRHPVSSRSKWQMGSTPQPCTETDGAGASSLRYGMLAETCQRKRIVDVLRRRETSGYVSTSCIHG